MNFRGPRVEGGGDVTRVLREEGRSLTPCKNTPPKSRVYSYFFLTPIFEELSMYNCEERFSGFQKKTDNKVVTNNESFVSLKLLLHKKISYLKKIKIKFFQSH